MEKENLDRFKIMAKLRKSVGDIEEFSDTPQGNSPISSSTDIHVPEIVMTDLGTLYSDSQEKDPKLNRL